MNTPLKTGLLGLALLSTAACGSSAAHPTPADNTDAGEDAPVEAGPSDDGGRDAGPRGTIVFAASSAPEAPPQVYAMDANGAHLAPLTTASTQSLPQGANDAPSFSPDGSLILFDSGRDFSADDGGIVQNPSVRMLYTMKADGSDAKRLTTNDPVVCVEHDGHFSHDGQWIAFAMSCSNGPNPNVDQVFRIKADGSGQAGLVAPTSGVGASNQGFPVFSTDDKTVFFIGTDAMSTSQIYAVDVASANVTQVTHIAAPSMLFPQAPPVVSSTGAIYFATFGMAGGSTPATFESIGATGNDQKTLFTIPGAGVAQWSNFALSPDETRLVFVVASPSDGGGFAATAIATSTLAGTDVQTLTTTTLYEATRPAWH